MKQFRYLYKPVFLLLLVLSSCTDDIWENDGGVVTSGLVTLTGEFSIPASSVVSTRASNKDENTIDSLHVFVFDRDFQGSDTEASNGSPKLMEVAVAQDLNVSTSGGTFKVHLTAGSDRKLVYILANSGAGRFYSSGDYSSQDVDLSDVVKQLRLGVSDDEYQRAKIGYPLPMSGRLFFAEGLTSATSLRLTGASDGSPVPLVRSVAKISVSISGFVRNSFKIRGVAVCHVSSGGHIISSQSPMDVFTQPDTRDGLSSGNVNFYNEEKNGLGAFLYQSADSSLVDSIYVYESKRTDASPVRLIVFGEYKGASPTYYPLDIVKDSTKVYDMVRNHHYKVTINTVSRLGVNSFDNALSASAFNKELGIAIVDSIATTTTTTVGNYVYSLDYDKVTVYADSLDGFNLSTLTTTYPSINEEGIINRLLASSNKVSGKSTLFFADGTTQSSFSLVYSDEVKKYPISVVMKPGFESGTITMHLGGYTQAINLVKKSHSIDLHYETLSVDSVNSIRLLTSTGSSTAERWVSLSEYPDYLENYQAAYLALRGDASAYVHVDENLDLRERIADFEYMDSENHKRRLYLVQVGTVRYDVGFFGGQLSNNGVDKANYSQHLLVEGYEEDGPLLYLPADATISAEDEKILTGIDGIASTKLLAEKGSPAALYCLNKNRGVFNSNGTINKDKILWYLPTVYQGLGISFYQFAVDNIEKSYWSSSLFVPSSLGTWDYGAFSLNTYKEKAIELEFPNTNGRSGPQLSSAYWREADGTRNGMARYIRCVRNH